MTIRRPRQTRLTIALAAGSLALAECGSSGGSDDAPVAALEAASAPVPPAGAHEATATKVDDAALFASVFATTVPIVSLEPAAAF